MCGQMQTGDLPLPIIRIKKNLKRVSADPFGVLDSISLFDRRDGMPNLRF